MRLRRRGVSVALMLAVLAACSATSAPERAFQTYRQAVADSDWALAWSLLSERVQGGYGGSHDLYSSEMKGFFARPDLRLQFTTTKVLGVDTHSWLRMSIGNASVTIVRIKPDGAMKLLGYADVGHLPPNMQTGLYYDTKELNVPSE